MKYYNTCIKRKKITLWFSRSRSIMDAFNIWRQSESACPSTPTSECIYYVLNLAKKFGTFNSQRIHGLWSQNSNHIRWFLFAFSAQYSEKIPFYNQVHYIQTNVLVSVASKSQDHILLLRLVGFDASMFIIIHRIRNSFLSSALTALETPEEKSLRIYVLLCKSSVRSWRKSHITHFYTE